MTLLAASVFGSSPAELRRQLLEAIERGAMAIELRLDMCEPMTLKDLQDLRAECPIGVPIILTIRSAREGGAWDEPDDERVSRLIELAPIADYVDVELDLWRRSANVRQKVSLAMHRRGSVDNERVRRLILSKHDMADRPKTLHSDFLEMLDESICDVPKIAFRARTVRDNFEVFDLLQTSPKRPIVICMGDDGLASRVLAKKFKAFATFASAEEGKATAPGQLTIRELRQLYRWDAIGPATAVYGLIGNPVAHSMSPHIHNSAFAAEGIDAVYLPIRVDPTYESFKAFMVETLARPWLGFCGFSVTTPHKEHARRFVEEHGGLVDDLAVRTGSVNTLVIDVAGKVSGHNTDAPAFIEEICALCGEPAKAFQGRTVAVLGAGGMARTGIRMLMDARADVTIFNRTDQAAESLAKETGARWKKWSERVSDRSWLLVNCTSAGLGDNESPMPAASLKLHEFVFDVVYRAGETQLVRDAKESGVSAAGGFGMLIRQAAAQFHIWTGVQLPVGSIQKSLINHYPTP